MAFIQCPHCAMHVPDPSRAAQLTADEDAEEPTTVDETEAASVPPGAAVQVTPSPEPPNAESDDEPKPSNDLDDENEHSHRGHKAKAKHKHAEKDEDEDALT